MVFDRPFPEPLPRWDDAGACGVDWATERKTREEIIGRYRRVREHSDATITARAIDSPGYVPWWPRPHVKLFNILVHVLTETSQHAGHADIVREQLDGSTGTVAEYAKPGRDAAFWEARCAEIEPAPVERVARRDTPGPHLMLRLALSDGRVLVAAGAHPAADGKYLRELHGILIGSALDQ